MFHFLPGSSTVHQLQSGKRQGFLINYFLFRFYKNPPAQTAGSTKTDHSNKSYALNAIRMWRAFLDALPE